MDKSTVRQIVTIILAVLTLSLLGFILFFVNEAKRKGPGNWGIQRIFQSPFSGKTAQLHPVLGVMVENELNARPFQVGLSEAAIVYEAPTEGGITRFLAIFPGEKYPVKIGPVRSARSYFLDWIHEYENAMYAHVGGRFDALERLRKENIRDTDQFFYENYFWRENVGKTALEHTMFTSGEKLKELAETKNWFPSPISHPLLSDAIPAIPAVTATTATKITIDFGFPIYKVTYDYDADQNLYMRKQINGPALVARTVIIQRVDSWSNNDAAGSISMKTIGSGQAFIFQNGGVVKGKWKKNSFKEPTRFFDENGAEISAGISPNSAPIWIEILPLYNNFKYG